MRFYIVPVIGDGTHADPRRPKHISDRMLVEGSWSAMDCGRVATMVVGADTTQREHDALSRVGVPSLEGDDPRLRECVRTHFLHQRMQALNGSLRAAARSFQMELPRQRAWSAGRVLRYLIDQPFRYTRACVDDPVVTDDFERSNSGTLGANWTATLSGSAGITSNKAGPAPDTDNLYGDYYSAVSFAADQYAQCNIFHPTGMPTAATGGPGVRCSGTAGSPPAGNATGYWMYYAVTVTQLTKVVGGTETLITTVVQSAANNDLDYLEMRGTTLKMKRQGTQLGSDQSDSAISSGAPGIVVQGSGGQADNWEGGDFAVPGGAYLCEPTIAGTLF